MDVLQESVLDLLLSFLLLNILLNVLLMIWAIRKAYYQRKRETTRSMSMLKSETLGQNDKEDQRNGVGEKDPIKTNEF